MTFTVADFHDLVELLEEHPEWRASLRRLVLSDEILTLPQIMRELAEAQKELAEAQKRTEQRLDRLEAVVQELAEAQKRTEQRLDRLEAVVQELAEAQKRTEQRLDRLEAVVQELAEAQKRTEQRLDRLEAVVQELAEAQKELAEAQKRTEETLRRVVDVQAELVGDQLERRYREKAFAYFGRLLRRVQVVSLQALEAELERHLSEAEMDDLALLDLLVRGQVAGRPDTPLVWLAIEVSAVADRNDVARAQQRARLLRKAGYAAIPAVAGRQITAGGEDAARAEGVALFQDGRRLFWEEALAQALSESPSANQP